MSAEGKLKELGIDLPEIAAPAGVYVPVKRVGSLLYVAGQLPLREGELISTGHVGRNVSVDEANAAARQCGLNILAALKSNRPLALLTCTSPRPLWWRNSRRGAFTKKRIPSHPPN